MSAPGASAGLPKLLLIGPVLLAFLVLLILPLAQLLSLSLRPDIPGGGLGADYTVENFARLVQSGSFQAALTRTLRVSFVITLLDLVLAYPVAYFMARRPNARVTGLLYLVLIAPLFISVAVRTFGWLVLLGPNGVVNAGLAALGLPRVSLLYNEAGVIIGMTHVLLPLMVLPLAASLQGIGWHLEEAARTLGAGPLMTFRRVIFPLSTPGLAAGSLIVFSLAMSGYVTPVILGGPRDGFLMAALITAQATQLGQLGIAATASVIFLLALIPLVVLHQRAERWLGSYEH